MAFDRTHHHGRYRRALSAGIVLVGALAGVACGGTDRARPNAARSDTQAPAAVTERSPAPPRERPLSPAEAVELARVNLSIARYCVEYLDQRTTRPSTDEYIRAVAALVRIYRRNPKALYRTGREIRTLRAVVSDQASALESCGLGADARRLDRVLRNG